METPFAAQILPMRNAVYVWIGPLARLPAAHAGDVAPDGIDFRRMQMPSLAMAAPSRFGKVPLTTKLFDAAVDANRIGAGVYSNAYNNISSSGCHTLLDEHGPIFFVGIYLLPNIYFVSTHIRMTLLLWLLRLCR